MKILSVVYVIGGLYAIITAAGSLYDVVRCKQQFAKVAVSQKSMVALVVILLISPIWWYYNRFMDPVLDGQYVIPIQLSDNKADVVAVDLDVSSYIDEEEHDSYSGGYEHTVTKSRRVYYAYINSIILPDGRTYSINRDIEAGQSFELYDYIDDDDYCWQEINIWPLSKSNLGISDSDIWKKQSIKTIYEPVLIEIACIYLLLQYYCYQNRNME